jgi:anti-sigma regulatory factor (Ser/Thr protein kinase)
MGVNGVSHEPTRTRRLDLSVPASPESLAEVRRSLETLAIPSNLVEDARLIVTELVGNSIRHSGLRPHEQVGITAEWSGTRLRVAVRDRSRPKAPSPVAGTIRPRAGAESGWGLFIVDRLATRWGTDEAGYWFELDGRRTGPD